MVDNELAVFGCKIRIPNNSKQPLNCTFEHRAPPISGVLHY
jgi:hypothetical protein